MSIMRSAVTCYGLSALSYDMGTIRYTDHPARDSSVDILSRSCTLSLVGLGVKAANDEDISQLAVVEKNDCSYHLHANDL
jgi:hypothetical protein